MLIDFEVENFRSYREAKRFSFVASAISENPENLIESPDLELKLLKSAALYGANGSGKSNLLLAMNSLGDMLDFPSDRPRALNFPRFSLDQSSSSKPTRFRIRFIKDSVIFEYGV